jgi:hypothetical protein
MASTLGSEYGADTTSCTRYSDAKVGERSLHASRTHVVRAVDIVHDNNAETVEMVHDNNAETVEMVHDNNAETADIVHRMDCTAFANCDDGMVDMVDHYFEDDRVVPLPFLEHDEFWGISSGNQIFGALVMIAQKVLWVTAIHRNQNQTLLPTTARLSRHIRQEKDQKCKKKKS